MRVLILFSSTFMLMISFLYGDDHYLDRYHPIAIWTLDQGPEEEQIGPTNGEYKSWLYGNLEKGVPKQILGARNFTGSAWDFADVETSLATAATGAFERLGDIENTKGISLAFWMKIPKDQHKHNHRIIGHATFEAGMQT